MSKKMQAAAIKAAIKLTKQPWAYEPNALHLKHSGLDCLILRNSHNLTLNGYVGLPPGHLLHADNVTSIDLHLLVHGGVTFAGSGDKIRDPSTQESKDFFGSDLRPDIVALLQDTTLWWVGFDCAHAFDLVPTFPITPPDPLDTYRDIAYVKREVKKLAAQLSNQTKLKTIQARLARLDKLAARLTGGAAPTAPA